MTCICGETTKFRLAFDNGRRTKVCLSCGRISSIEEVQWGVDVARGESEGFVGIWGDRPKMVWLDEVTLFPKNHIETIMKAMQKRLSEVKMTHIDGTPVPTYYTLEEILDKVGLKDVDAG